MIRFANSCVLREPNSCEFFASRYVSATSTDRTVYRIFSNLIRTLFAVPEG